MKFAAVTRRRFGTRVVLPVVLIAAFAGVLLFAARDALVPRTDVRVVPVVLRATHPEPWRDFRLWSADSFVQRSDDLSGLKEAVRNLLPGEAT